jgi:hypothetical protein
MIYMKAWHGKERRHKKTRGQEGKKTQEGKRAERKGGIRGQINEDRKDMQGGEQGGNEGQRRGRRARIACKISD